MSGGIHSVGDCGKKDKQRIERGVKATLALLAEPGTPSCREEAMHVWQSERFLSLMEEELSPSECVQAASWMIPIIELKHWRVRSSAYSEKH